MKLSTLANETIRKSETISSNRKRGYRGQCRFGEKRRCTAIKQQSQKHIKCRKRLVCRLFRNKTRTLMLTLIVSILAFLYGPSDRVRTCGLMVPNHPRYQLRYTRIFDFSDYITRQIICQDFRVCKFVVVLGRLRNGLQNNSNPKHPSRWCPHSKDFGALAVRLGDRRIATPKLPAPSF